MKLDLEDLADIVETCFLPKVMSIRLWRSRG